MKRKLLFLVLLILSLSLLLTACGDNGDKDEKKVTSIAVVDGTVALEYEVGDTPDFSGLKAVVKYDNGDEETLGIDKLTVSALDTTKAGPKKITVSYKGVQTYVDVVVNEKAPEVVTLTKIEIVESSISSTVPQGQTYDTSGLQVEATYSDETVKIIGSASLTVSPIDTSTTGEKTLTVTYGGMTDTMIVTVTGITGITVAEGTLKNTVYVGEAYDTSLLEVIVYSTDKPDGEVHTVADLQVGSIDTATAGTKTLSITYNGFTLDFEVTVIGIASITINAGSVATTLKIGETLDISNIAAKLTYTNGVVKPLTAADLEVQNISTATLGAKQLTVSYNGTVSQPYTVNVIGVKTMTVNGIADEILVGQELSTADAWLSVTYTDDSTATVRSGIAFGQFSSATKGTKALSVTYLDKTVEIDVDVCGIASISVSGVPDSTVVNTGALDLSEMTVKAVYSNGTMVTVPASKVSAQGVNTTILGRQNLTVTYTDDYEGVFTAVVSVDVLGVGEISISGGYDAYVKAGSVINTDNVKITVVYTDGTILRNVTPTTVSANNTTGLITASYTENGITATASVAVTVCEPIGIKVLGVPVTYKSDSDVTIADVAPNMRVYLYYATESSLSDDEVTEYTTNFDDIKSQFAQENADIELVVTANGFSISVPISTTAPDFDGIRIDEFAAYVAINKAYDKNSIKVFAVYGNGREDAILFNDLTIDGIDDTSVAGEKTVTVSYNGKQATVSVQVLPITSISATGIPELINIGTDINVDNIDVTVTYSNSNYSVTEALDSTLTDITVDFDKNLAGEQTVTIGCLGATCEVTVYVKALESIEITGSYPEFVKAGTEIDTTGITVTAIYNNGDRVEALDPTSISVDGGVITVVYGTASATVNVRILPLSALSATIEPSTFDKGTDISALKAALDITATYADSINSVNEIVDISNVTITGYNKDEGDDQTLTLSYTVAGVTKECTVNVHVKAIDKIEILEGSVYTVITQGESWDISNLKIEVTFTNDDVVIIPAAQYATVSGENNNVLTVTYEGKTATVTAEVRTMEIVQAHAINGTVPSSVLIGSDVDYDAMRLTVIYEDSDGKRYTYLIGRNDSRLTIVGIDTSTTGEKVITFKFTGYADVIVRVEVIDISKIEVVTGTLQTTLNVGQDLDTSELDLKVTYSDGTYVYIDNESPEFSDVIFGSIDTSSAGSKTFRITYSGVSLDITITVVQAATDGFIAGVALPDTFVARDSYAQNFNVKDEMYVVGDDNAFKFYLDILVLDENDEIVDADGSAFKYDISVYTGTEAKAENLLSGDALTSIVSIDTNNNTYDFASAAVGQVYTIQITPKEAYIDDATRSITVEVVDAYNIYEAWELNIITNDDDDINGGDDPIDVNGNSTGNALSQLDLVKSFLEAKGINDPITLSNSLKGVVIHNNLNVTTRDIPAKYIYNYTKNGVAQTGFYDKINIFSRNLTDSNPNFTIYGNYFSIYSYSLPCIIENGYHPTSTDNFSGADLICISTGTVGTGFNHKNYHGRIENLALRDNDPNSNDQAASERHMRGLVCIKTLRNETTVYNTNIDAYYISMVPEADDLTVNLDYVRFYNSWQGHLFIWNTNSVNNVIYGEEHANDGQLHENYQNIKINIRNSLLAKCGGPVILSQTADKDKARNVNSGADITVDENSTLYSYVTGQEAWFVAVGQTAVAAQIFALDQPITGTVSGLNSAGVPAMYGKESYSASFLANDKIAGVSTMNMIMVNMGDGFGFEDKGYTGSFKVVDSDGNVIKTGLNMKSDNTDLATYKSALAAAGAPIFQTSSGGIFYYSAPGGNHGAYDLASGQYAMAPNNYEGDYITLYLMGMGIMLEYYH